MSRIMSCVNRCPLPFEIGCVFHIGVTSGNRQPPTLGDKCDRTHPGAGYPHEMDRSGIFRGTKVHWWAANIRWTRKLRKVLDLAHQAQNVSSDALGGVRLPARSSRLPHGPKPGGMVQEPREFFT